MRNKLKMRRKSHCWAWCCTSLILGTGVAKASLVCMRDVLASRSYISETLPQKKEEGGRIVSFLK